mmetsp:Transcript_42995/g.84507  ORF Transcript_42995/g.84507 Transcript_42995/m.84507 type:complete len:174 (+) Transcript_42995:523-1044(+)
MSVRQTSARKLPTGEIEEQVMKYFCIAMDNYFTSPKVMPELRKNDIDTSGTSRFKQNWPPKNLKLIKQKDCNIDNFYQTVDKHGTLVACWMDNGLVFCISTIYQVWEIFQINRKRSRLTQNNSAHVKNVWGTGGKKEISIPNFIDDYNKKIRGADLVDQRIVYYQPNLCCQRN